MRARDPLGRAVAEAIALLRQGAGIAELAERAGLADDTPLGPHLRHVIEHYEALLTGLDDGLVDYDARPRDRRVERDPALARSRCEQLADSYAARLSRPWPDTLVVACDAGVDGADRHLAGSTPARELLFVASHAVHHYALLRLALAPLGLHLPDGVGKAPSTLRHERGPRP